MEDLVHRIALTFIPHVGPVTAKNLIHYCGSPRAVFESSKKALLKIPGIGPQIASAIIRRDVFRAATAEAKYIEKNRIQLLFYLDAGYPRRLLPYAESPLLLYYRGTADLNGERTVAIVGTRQPSAYGLACCHRLVEGLLPYEVVVYSGLAFGIDVAAHRKCLEVGIPTVGVLGHGLDHLYPPQHRAIAERMTEQGGLLSEYPSRTPPEREHFPMRNRIVAALCDAVVVIETAKKGGSMITAQIANDYHKDVFALPGRVNDPRAAGCHYLIKTHRASLLENVSDLVYLMHWGKKESPKNYQQQLFTELSDDEKIIVDLLGEREEATIDELTLASQKTNSQMASLLLGLECKGVIKTLPGKRFTLL